MKSESINLIPINYIDCCTKGKKGVFAGNDDIEQYTYLTLSKCSFQIKFFYAYFLPVSTEQCHINDSKN